MECCGNWQENAKNNQDSWGRMTMMIVIDDTLSKVESVQNKNVIWSLVGSGQSIRVRVVIG